MSRDKIFFLLLIASIFTAPLVVADDLELMTAPTGASGSQSTFSDFFGYLLYGKEVTNTDGTGDGAIGGVGGGESGGVGQDIIVTPPQTDLTISPGQTAVSTFRITNNGASTTDVIVDLGRYDSELEERILFDGQQPPYQITIPNRNAPQNYRDVQVTVLTDFTGGIRSQKKFDINVEITPLTASGYQEHILKLTVAPEGVFTLTGLATADVFSVTEREPVCVTDAITGEETCREPFTNRLAGIAVSVWQITLLIILIGGGWLFLYLRKKKRPVVYYGQEGFYQVDPEAKKKEDRITQWTPTGEEEFYYVEPEEFEEEFKETQDGGYRF